MGIPYADQLAAKDEAVRSLIGPRPGLAWAPPVPSRESGFRTKSTMAVAGTPQAPTLGILDPAGHGVDLSACGLLGPATAVAMPRLREFIGEAGLRPYDVPRRSGELKQVHVVESADGGLLVRFVLRSPGQIGRLRRHLPRLRELLPGLHVVSVNLLPGHQALTAGTEEILLSEEATMPLPVGDVTLHVMPGAFVQTNAEVAGELYRQAARWTAAAAPASVLDIYCGVGGFALHAAGPGRIVHGVEISAQAVAAARRSAADAGLAATFECGDATRYALGLDEPPDLVIVNPPRRGIGPALAGWLETTQVPAVIYSSCNPASLARDLESMPSLRPVEARLFDMFPQTGHAEVLMLLTRT